MTAEYIAELEAIIERHKAEREHFMEMARKEVFQEMEKLRQHVSAMKTTLDWRDVVEQKLRAKHKMRLKTFKGDREKLLEAEARVKTLFTIIDDKVAECERLRGILLPLGVNV